MKISAFLPVYNEESRIKYTLQSFQWCDEIIILDKSSTDNTVSICKNYTTKVIEIPNSNAYESSEFNYLDKCNGDWIVIVTASDIIDRSLAMEIRKQIKILPEDIGCIEVPFKNYIFGIEEKRSPWHGSHRIKVFRKDNYLINKDVHGALSFKNLKTYKIPEQFGFFSHLTHVSVDMMLDRHMRYWRGEAEMNKERTLTPAFERVWESAKETIRRRKTFFLGWDGIALTFAYVSYYMFSFLYIWEKRRNGKAAKVYKELREKNIEDWTQ